LYENITDIPSLQLESNRKLVHHVEVGAAAGVGAPPILPYLMGKCTGKNSIDKYLA
jgi:hypothetical protein